jgi:hypothetical protein
VASIRLPLLLGTVLIAAAGCANQPERANQNTPQASSSAPPSATAADDSAANSASNAALKEMQKSVGPHLLMFAHDQGYSQVMIKDKSYYFCKVEDPMGSIIPVRQCISQAQLETLQVQVQQQREQIQRCQGCSAGSGGG